MSSKDKYNLELLKAATSGDEKSIEALLANGADVNVKLGVAGKESMVITWETPLLNAIFSHNKHAAEMLIAKGARVDSVALLDVELLTEDMLEMLVAHGADVNIADDIGRTPLMEATRLDKADFAKFLITHGARVDARDSEGMTALMIASANARPKAARLLVSHGADVNAKDKVGWTPLMYAAACRSAEISKLLISHGAHVNATGTKTGGQR